MASKKQDRQRSSFPNPFEQEPTFPTQQPIELGKIQTTDSKKNTTKQDDTKLQADLEAAKDELTARARELDQREQQLHEKENLLLEREGKGRRNWPPFCPVVTYSVADIQPKHRLLCRVGFAYCHVHVLALVCNAVYNIIDFGIVDLVLALVYASVGIYVAWSSQYQRLHTALRAGMNADIKLLMCMINYGVSAIFNAMMTLGLVGGAGLLRFASVNGVVLQVLLSLSFSVWLLSLVTCVFVLRGVVGVWRGEGGNVDKAKAAMASEAIHHVTTSEEGSWGNRTANKKVNLSFEKCVVQ